MIPLSEWAKQRGPRPRRPLIGTPVAVPEAALRISRTWPDIEGDDPEADPNQLVRELHRRYRLHRQHRSDAWTDYSWRDLSQAARALMDSERWRRVQYKRLLPFLLDQVHPGVNKPYLRTLVQKYMDTFEPGSGLTRDLAPVLRVHWPAADLPLEKLVNRFRIFDLDSAPPRAMAEFMVGQNDPFTAVRKMGVVAPHGPGLMTVAHSEFVSALAPRIANSEEDAVRKLLSWIKPAYEREPLEGEGAAVAIDALLEPWHASDPIPELQRLIEERLLAFYDDPRTRPSGAWSLVSDTSTNVILRWLAGETIELFFDIVSKAVAGVHSGHMWRDRQGLWRDLYSENRITEAWFALSKDGARVADDLQEQRDIRLPYGRNQSGESSDRTKCLLIMKVQGRWVVEGSHSFPTWVFSRADPTVLERNGSSYTCEQFRDMRYRRGVVRITHTQAWRNSVLRAISR